MTTTSTTTTASTASTHVPVLVVGAGPTGLGAAWVCERQGTAYLLVEAQGTPGGLARTVVEGGYRWDLGGHVIHSHFTDFDDAVRQGGVELVDVERTGAVLVGADTLVDVPLQRQLDTLPLDIRPGAPAAHLADYLRNEMGGALYASFFLPFNTKMWAHPLDRVDHVWTSHRSGSSASNVPMVGLRQPPGPRESFPYPRGGSGDVWNGVAARLDPARLVYGTRLTGLDLAGRRASFAGAPDVTYERLVSSVPLDLLCGLVGDPRCEELASHLVRTRVTAIGLGFRGTIPAALARSTYIYSGDPQVPWYRASVLSNYSAQMAPDGCWSVLFECSSAPDGPEVDLEIAQRAALASLVALGADASRLDVRWSHRLDRGYPVPTLGRDAVLADLHELLEGYGVLSRGRFGGWRYESCNQDHAFAQGVEAVVTGGSDVLWHPERF